MDSGPDLQAIAVAKVALARTALTKHLGFLPGSLVVFNQMLRKVINTGEHMSAAGLKQIFPTVPDDDIQAVENALVATKALRTEVLKQPEDR